MIPIWLWLLGGGAVAWYLFGSKGASSSGVSIPTNTPGLVPSDPNVYIDSNGQLVLPNRTPAPPMPAAGTFAVPLTTLQPLPGEIDPSTGTTRLGPGGSAVPMPIQFHHAVGPLPSPQPPATRPITGPFRRRL